MSDAVHFALLGLGAGAVYALLGQGLVLVYRGSGVLNLAQGAFAMVGAYLYYELHVVHGFATLPAIIVGVVVLGLLGVVVDQLLMRRLRRGAALAPLIGTLGVMLILQSIGILRYGANSLLIGPLIPSKPIDLLGTTVGSDRLWLLGLAVVLTIVLTLLWNHTAFGWRLSAVSENRRAAAALGWSPDRASLLTWALGSGLAGLAGMLVAPIVQLAVTQLTLLAFPALAAALIGRFRSFPLTLGAGVFLGIAESEVGRYVHLTGASSALPFLAVVAVLLIGGTALPTRGQHSDRPPRLGLGHVNVAVAAPLFAIGAVLISLVFSSDWLNATIVWFAVGTILLSLVVLTGYAGQLSLAQYALAGIGALLAARLVEAQGWRFELALVAGVLGTTLVGLLFALPALRTRGVQLAVVTLGLGVAAQELLFNNMDVTGTASGTPVGAPDLFGLSIDAYDHPERYAIFAFAAFAVCALAVANLRRGRAGRRLIAVRSNERAASALGIDVFAAKFHAFALAGALAGLGGIVLAFHFSTVTYQAFGPFDSINAVALAVIGGVGFIAGPVVGGLVAVGSLGATSAGLTGSEASSYLPLIGGVAMVATLLLHPDGVASAGVDPLRPLAERFGFVRSGQTAPEVDQSPLGRVPARRLEVKGLTVRYGGVHAVEGVSLTVDAGEIVGLIGPNGAGKTSFIDGVSGLVSASGRIVFAGEEVASWPAHRRARAGIVRSFQSLELFEDMTVLENLQTAADRRDMAATVMDLARPGRVRLSPMAAASVDVFGLQGCLERRPAELPYGQRRLLAISRAVAAAPSVLLLDEPVAGLDTVESRELAELIRLIAEKWGIGVLLIEHNMEFVMGLCDRIVVMDFGRTIATGTPEQIRRDPAAIAAYLGEEPDATAAPLDGVRS
jgi:sulfate-transporting ATPase